LDENTLSYKISKYYLRGALKSYWNFVVDHGEGPYIFNVDGRKYLDYSLGGGPMILGHCHPSVIKAVQERVKKGSQLYIANQPAIELAEEICQASPCADKVFFTNSGTEACICAVRLARAFTGKDGILRFEGGYHGFHDEMLRSSSLADPSKLMDFPSATFDSEGIPKAIDKTVFVSPYNNTNVAERIIDENEDKLAAVIVEPIQRLIVPKSNFLNNLRKITSKKNVILIFDEVVTGFRFAYGGAQELYGVVPDLATYGKIIGGGFPIGAVGGKDEIMALNSATTGHRVVCIGTFSGNPVSCTAGLATLRELQKKGTYESLNQYGSELREELRKIFDENDVDAQILGTGPMSGYAFTDNPITDFRSWSTRDALMDEILTQELLKRQLVTDLPKLYSSTCHGEEEKERTIEIFSNSVEEAVTKRQKSKGKRIRQKFA
jgi:glutamate-1-semialdehyde 2,1-aminomutase